MDNYDRLASLSASPITKGFVFKLIDSSKHQAQSQHSVKWHQVCQVFGCHTTKFPKQLHPTPGNWGRRPPWEAKLLPLKACRIGQDFAATNRATSNYVRVPAVTRCCSVAPVPLRICTACVSRCPKWRRAFCSASAKDHWDAEGD